MRSVALHLDKIVDQLIAVIKSGRSDEERDSSLGYPFDVLALIGATKGGDLAEHVPPLHYSLNHMDRQPSQVIDLLDSLQGSTVTIHNLT